MTPPRLYTGYCNKCGVFVEDSKSDNWFRCQQCRIIHRCKTADSRPCTAEMAQKIVALLMETAPRYSDCVVAFRGTGQCRSMARARRLPKGGFRES